MTKLIIIRGNSGSGKTTTARRLQQTFPAGTAMLVSQDVVRIGMLNVKDHPDNPAIDLIQTLCEYGKNRFDYVILEGILGASKYRSMLLSLITDFDNQAWVYYYDLTFAETLKRHQQRAKSLEFGKTEMQRWWLEKDYLDVSREMILTSDLNQDAVVELIRKAVKS